MKKRILACALCALMLLPFAVACGESNPPDTGDNGEITQPNPEEKPEKPTKHEYKLSLNKHNLLLALSAPYDSVTELATVTEDGKPLPNANITYTSADEAVATIDENGVVTAVAAGETSITASYESVSATTRVRVLASATAEEINAFDESAVNLYSRTYVGSKRVTFDNVCAGVDIAFAGTKLTGSFTVSNMSKIRVFVDGDTDGKEMILEKTGEVTLCELAAGVHTVRVLKAASPQYKSITMPVGKAFQTDGEFLKAPAKSDLKIEFIGDSITAGCGSLGKSSQTQTVENSDPTKAYAYLTAQALDADFNIQALEGVCAKDGGINAFNTYMNYGYNMNVPYDATKFDADVVVIGLGENDMWHATSDLFTYTVEAFRTDYADLIRLVRQSHPNAAIVCAFGMMPASSTKQAEETIRAAVKDTEDSNVYCVKMLSNEAGGASHPNAASHKKNAETLTALIREILAK
ncbi:MAG: Ig-like domain-containing protein [Clostridia bacterium]|nr:Ig-like domain-containing protein [Clostridia bacterium]